MRRAAKRDASEPDIVTALESVGALVERLDLPVDLLVKFRGTLHLLEVKTPGASLTRKDREKQREFCSTWNVPIVSTPTEALRAIGAIRESAAA